MRGKKYSYEVSADLGCKESKKNDYLKANSKKGFYDNNNNEAVHIIVESNVKEDSNDYIIKEKIFDSIASPINQSDVNHIWKSNEPNSSADYEWSSRGNRSIKYSPKLCVPKRELYRSCTPSLKFFGQKNNQKCRLKRTEIKNKSQISKISQILSNEQIRNTKNSIENYFCKSKYVDSRCISTGSQMIPLQTGLSTQPSNTEKKLFHTSLIANEDDSAYLHSDSQFNINIALQLSSQISYEKASKIKSKEEILGNVPIKRYIHEKIFSDESILSNNWISLNLFEKRSLNEKLSRNSHSTIKAQHKEYRCLTSPNENSMSIQEENHNIINYDRSGKNKLLQKSLQSDWISRGIRPIRSSCCEITLQASSKTSGTSNPLYKRKYFSNNIPSSFSHKKSFKCKNSPISNENRRQRSINEYVTRKDEKLKQKTHLNDNKKIDSIFSIKEQDIASYNKNKIVCKLDDLRGQLREKIVENTESNIYDANISENTLSLNIKGSEDIPLEVSTINQIEDNIFDEQIYEDDCSAKPSSLTKTDFNNSELYSCPSAVDNIETYSKDNGTSDNSKIVSMSFVSEGTGKLISPAVCTLGHNANNLIDMQYPKVSNGMGRHHEEIASGNSKSAELFLCQSSDVIQVPFSKDNYNTLEALSSPVLIDPECQAYLKTLVNENIKQETKKCNKSFYKAKATSNQSDLRLISCEVLPEDQTDSEENNFLQFWENMLSQNHLECSQNNEYSSLTQNNHHAIEKVSQNGSEIFQYILSPKCAESDSLLNNAMKNMNNLSMKIMEKISSVYNSNKNANKILKLALTIYAEHKERSILSKSQSPESTASNLGFIRKCEGSVWTYTIIRILDIDNHKLGNCSTENEKMCRWTHDLCTRTVTEADTKILLGLKEICLNTSYHYVEHDDGPCNISNSRFIVINKIKTIFDNVLNDFDTNKSPCLEIRRQTFEECSFINGRLELKLEENSKMIKVKYQNTSSQFKFCLMMYILAKVLQILESNSKTTRRELYYQIKHLISNQSHVDRAVKAISCMLCVGPWDLNIVAHKGMVFGDLKITMSSNEIVDCNLPGTLIPQDVDEISELKSSAFFILVVEKESIFYKILEEKLPNTLVRPFLMITGKGFPDLNTQLFLKKLWMMMSIPIFIFTDADPHGISIMITYRFGSLANAHLSQQLAIPKAQWLGVFPSEIVRLNADRQVLTEIEKNVIKNMLKTPYMKINKKIEEELKFMLASGYKAGIEGIIKNHNFLSEFYFPLKFHNKDLI